MEESSNDCKCKNVNYEFVQFYPRYMVGKRLTPLVYSGKKKDHTVTNVLLVNALLIILFLSDTYGGRVHDQPIADATPYPLPAGSRLVQDLGFLAFTLPQVAILMPTKKPRGQELPLEEQRANQALHQRRLRIEPVNSSVKGCRSVKDRSRLWKVGVRDLVRDICCALHKAQNERCCHQRQSSFISL